MDENVDILPFVSPQPKPIRILVGRLPAGQKTVSAITRQWANGDEKLCRLCPVCTASHGICTVLTTGEVPTSRQELAAFSILGSRWHGPGVVIGDSG